MGNKVRKVAVDMYEDRLQQDLERYRAKALELGATQAKIVKVEEIPVDERVTLKCQIPRCFGYGVSAHCPPNTMKPAELRDLLKKYHWAVFFIKEVASEVIVRDKATIKERVAAYQHVYKIVNELESAAFMVLAILCAFWAMLAFMSLMGLLLKRGTLWGALYFFIWEPLVGIFPPFLQW